MISHVGLSELSHTTSTTWYSSYCAITSDPSTKRPKLEILQSAINTCLFIDILSLWLIWKKKKKSVITKTSHLPENDNLYLDTMTSTNSSNDRLVLCQNVEINSNEYFSCDVFFREWNRRPRGLETSLRNHQEICLWVQSYFNDLSWFIERLSVKIFIYSSFVTIDDVIFLFFKNFPS